MFASATCVQASLSCWEAKTDGDYGSQDSIVWQQKIHLHRRRHIEPVIVILEIPTPSLLLAILYPLLLSDTNGEL